MRRVCTLLHVRFALRTYARKFRGPVTKLLSGNVEVASSTLPGLEHVRGAKVMGSTSRGDEQR